MIIALHIEMPTQWGTQMYVTTGKKPMVGLKLPKNAIEMDNDGRGNWFVEVDAEQLNAKAYHYVLAYQRIVLRNEFGEGHRIAGLEEAIGRGDVPCLRVWDGWRRLPRVRSFFSLVFRGRKVQMHDTEVLLDELQPDNMTLACVAPAMPDGQVVALIGNVPELGDWDPGKAVVMQQVGQFLWSVTVSRKTLHYPLRFKFVVLDKLTHEFVAWENCTNRFFEPSILRPGDSILINNQRFVK